jgi:hypothetical protein
MHKIVGPNFKVGDYLYTYHDNGCTADAVYLRVVKITPKMVWLRGEHSAAAFLKSRNFVESLYPLGSSDWRPEIKL